METACKLTSIEFSVDEEWLAAFVLAALTDKYRSLILSFETQSGTLLSESIKMTLVMQIMTHHKRSTLHFWRKRQENRWRNSEKTWGNAKCAIRKNIKVLVIRKNNYCYSSSSKNRRVHPRHRRAFLAMTSRPKSDEWCIDSGASSHMTPDISILGNRKPSPINEIPIANNDKKQVKCSGDNIMRLNSTELNAIGVPHVPDLSNDFFQCSKWWKHAKKWYLVVMAVHCTIFDKDDILFANCKPAAGVYIFKATASAYLLSKRDENTALTRHRRFGHLNIDNISKMKIIATGMNFKDAKITDSNCRVCAMGKQHRDPFKSS